MSNMPLSEKEIRAIRYIRNAIVHEGYSPSVRDLAKELGYKSPRTAFLILSRLIEAKWLGRRPDGELQLLRNMVENESHARTVDVPLVGSVACGAPLLAEENIEAHVPVSTTLATPGGQYFLLRAKGDSMNEASIEGGDLVLVRQQSVAENGDRVVALIDDEATIKEFHRSKGVVVLQPRSRNRSHVPIVVSENFAIQGKVVATVPNIQ